MSTDNQQPQYFKDKLRVAADEYKNKSKVDRDGGFLSDFDFAKGAEWAFDILSDEINNWRVKNDSMGRVIKKVMAEADYFRSSLEELAKDDNYSEVINGVLNCCPGSISNLLK